jgi:hypothetical protein
MSNSFHSVFEKLSGGIEATKRNLFVQQNKIPRDFVYRIFQRLSSDGVNAFSWPREMIMIINDEAPF